MCSTPVATRATFRASAWHSQGSRLESAALHLLRRYARTRQILQWVFAAAPGHPVLRNVCDQIARNVQHTYSQDTRLDTLERTGPGIFTDTVVKHAGLHAPKKVGPECLPCKAQQSNVNVLVSLVSSHLTHRAVSLTPGQLWCTMYTPGAKLHRCKPPCLQREDPWTVRILPRVQFGAPRSPAYGLSPNDPSVAVLHHALASWRLQQRWARGDGCIRTCTRWFDYHKLPFSSAICKLRQFWLNLRSVCDLELLLVHIS